MCSGPCLSSAEADMTTSAPASRYLATSSGVSTPVVAGYLLAGADVVMSASALLRHGPEHTTVLLEGLRDWMERKGFTSVPAFRGLLAVPPDADETLYERAGYVSALRNANENTFGPWS